MTVGGPLWNAVEDLRAENAQFPLGWWTMNPTQHVAVLHCNTIYDVSDISDKEITANLDDGLLISMGDIWHLPFTSSLQPCEWWRWNITRCSTMRSNWVSNSLCSMLYWSRWTGNIAHSEFDHLQWKRKSSKWHIQYRNVVVQRCLRTSLSHLSLNSNATLTYSCTEILAMFKLQQTFPVYGIVLQIWHGARQRWAIWRSGCKTQCDMQIPV